MQTKSYWGGRNQGGSKRICVSLESLEILKNQCRKSGDGLSILDGYTYIRTTGGKVQKKNRITRAALSPAIRVNASITRGSMPFCTVPRMVVASASLTVGVPFGLLVVEGEITGKLIP